MLSRRDFLKIALMSLGFPFLKPFLQPFWADGNCLDVVWHGDRTKKTIAITFDDCYDFEALVQLEKILDKNPEISVTFFPTGIALLNTFVKDREIWRRLFTKGHEIGYHGYSHEWPSSLTYHQTNEDFDRWHEVLEKVLANNYKLKFARPPYGDLSQNFLRVCCERSIFPVMWSANWSTVHKTNYQDIQVKRGDIVIFHIRYQDVENFRTVLPMLRQQAWQLVNLSGLLLNQDAREEVFEEFLCDELSAFCQKRSKICIR